MPVPSHPSGKSHCRGSASSQTTSAPCSRRHSAASPGLSATGPERDAPGSGRLHDRAGERREHRADERTAVAERLDGDLDFTVAHEHVDRVLHPLDRHRLPARRLAGADHYFIYHDPQDAVRPAVGQCVDLAADERPRCVRALITVLARSYARCAACEPALTIAEPRAVTGSVATRSSGELVTGDMVTTRDHSSGISTSRRPLASAAARRSPASGCDSSAKTASCSVARVIPT